MAETPPCHLPRRSNDSDTAVAPTQGQPMTPRSSGSHTEIRKPAPIANWSKLSRADYVQIHQHGEVIATGRIDMLAADGSVLWLHLAGGNERAIFLQSDGLRIYRSHRSAAN